MYLVFIIFLYEITQMCLKYAPKKNYMLRLSEVKFLTLDVIVVWQNRDTLMMKVFSKEDA